METDLSSQEGNIKEEEKNLSACMLGIINWLLFLSCHSY